MADHVERGPAAGAHASTTPGGAVVIGGDYRGLGIVRSLGRHGVPVWVLTDEHRVAGTSRYARRSLPWPEGDEARQFEYLEHLALRHGRAGWALFPTGDPTAALIARHHAELSAHFALTTPPWEIMRLAHDKRLSYQLAATAGIDHPRTWYPSAEASLAEIDAEFPLILKPATRDTLNPLTVQKAWPVCNPAELATRYADAVSLMGSPDAVMVQELIPGGGDSQLAYAALCLDGEPLADVVARRSRQYPIDFGRASTFVEAIDDSEVEHLGRRWLRAARFTGLVEVEFKRDPRDGRCKLLDVNPRVWGWHTLGEGSGVDFSYLQWRMLTGERLPRLRVRTGTRWIRVAMDIPAAATEMLRGRLSPVDYARGLLGPLQFAIFAVDDPLPGLADLPILLTIGLRRRASARASNGPARADPGRLGLVAEAEPEEAELARR